MPTSTWCSGSRCVTADDIHAALVAAARPRRRSRSRRARHGRRPAAARPAHVAALGRARHPPRRRRAPGPRTARRRRRPTPAWPSLGIIHHNKSGSTDPLQLVMGSRGLHRCRPLGAHRACATPTTRPGRRRLFGTPKNNLGPRRPSDARIHHRRLRRRDRRRHRLDRPRRVGRGARREHHRDDATRWRVRGRPLCGERSGGLAERLPDSQGGSAPRLTSSGSDGPDHPAGSSQRSPGHPRAPR